MIVGGRTVVARTVVGSRIAVVVEEEKEIMGIAAGEVADVDTVAAAGTSFLADTGVSQNKSKRRHGVCHVVPSCWLVLGLSLIHI